MPRHEISPVILQAMVDNYATEAFILLKGISMFGKSELEVQLPDNFDPRADTHVAIRMSTENLQNLLGMFTEVDEFLKRGAVYNTMDELKDRVHIPQEEDGDGDLADLPREG
jgi:hypothetical protein